MIEKLVFTHHPVVGNLYATQSVSEILKQTCANRTLHNVNECNVPCRPIVSNRRDCLKTDTYIPSCTPAFADTIGFSLEGLPEHLHAADRGDHAMFGWIRAESCSTVK